MPTRYTIQDMQFFAKQMGGKCFSKEYTDLRSPLAWMCERGHTWDAPASIISRGGWCPQCSKRTEKSERLKLLKEIAKEKGGKCLSDEYVNNRTKLEWQCAQNHLWKAAPFSIYNNHQWCPVCGRERMAEKRRDDISKYQKIARTRGGLLLSKAYVNSLTPLQWQCRNGHQWLATPGSIFQGTWCPVCGIKKAGEKRRASIQEFQKLAIKRGGKLLSKKYANNSTPLKWQCKEGHTWKAPATRIKNLQNWCPRCYEKRRGKSLLLNIDDLRKLALSRKGKLLSNIYVNSTTPLRWQCEKGHIWKARADNVKNLKNWCAICAANKRAEKTRINIEVLKKWAKSRNGKLISTEYYNSITPVKWQCNHGHQWNARYSDVIHKNSWCPVCARLKRIKTPASVT